MKRLFTLALTAAFATAVFAPAFAQTGTATAPPAKPEMKAEKKAEAKKEAKKELVDINTASEDDLKALPTIGEAKAKKIVEGRPWASKDQLVDKKILTKAEYAKVKGMLIAKQAAK